MWKSFVIALMAALLTGCHKEERSVSISGTRELTLFDRKYPANIKDHPPLGWRRIPGTQMRVISYVTGPDDAVEIFMGISQGGILANANRWLGQYGAPAAGELGSFEKIEVLGSDAYLVEASGDVAAGMGNPAKTGQGLLGFVRQSGDDVMTVKMVGPAQLVVAQKAAFLEYAASLELIDTHILPSS